ncbi:hypothetical protein QUC31_015515 [Theobroma cacao]|uniref:Binding protein, putative n=1 Tax=Theobroma cacao TaxID=3641 RepID=A0A061E690_THECC|nr:Binding protein, putative [Theobroma cacao]
MAMAECPKFSSLRSCVNHLSHNHPLRPIEVKAEEELICSGCGLELSGSAYKCSKSNCQFLLHKSRFILEPVLEHKSHPDHPLTLLFPSPQIYRNEWFICNACCDLGTSFDYHCSSCSMLTTNTLLLSSIPPPATRKSRPSSAMRITKLFARNAGSITVGSAIMVPTSVVQSTNAEKF